MHTTLALIYYGIYTLRYFPISYILGIKDLNRHYNYLLNVSMKNRVRNKIATKSICTLHFSLRLAFRIRGIKFSCRTKV